jgi:hypothetical protein
MFGSLMLDVAIGMVLVYLLLSFVAAAVREGVETVLKERSRYLQRGVTELLHDEDLTAALFSHPQVSALYRGDYATALRNKELPSYIRRATSRSRCSTLRSGDAIQTRRPRPDPDRRRCRFRPSARM